MKKIIISGCLIAICLYGQSCKEKKTEAVAVPEVVINAFNEKYPGITEVKWEATGKNGKVVYYGEFETNCKSIEAKFDETGRFVHEKRFNEKTACK